MTNEDMSGMFIDGGTNERCVICGVPGHAVGIDGFCEACKPASKGEGGKG